MQTRHVRTAAVTLALALALAGCGNEGSTSTSTTTADKGTTTTKTQDIQVTTPDGQVSLSLNGKLPPNWPTSFPVPEGATPAGSGSLGGTEKTAMVAAFQTSASTQDTYNFYATNTSLTVESKSALGVGDAYVGTVKLGGAQPGRVTVVPREGKTLVIVMLETAGAGSTTTAATTGTTAAATTTTAG